MVAEPREVVHLVAVAEHLDVRAGSLAVEQLAREGVDDQPRRRAASGARRRAGVRLEVDELDVAADAQIARPGAATAMSTVRVVLGPVRSGRKPSLQSRAGAGTASGRAACGSPLSRSGSSNGCTSRHTSIGSGSRSCCARRLAAGAQVRVDPAARPPRRVSRGRPSPRTARRSRQRGRAAVSRMASSRIRVSGATSRSSPSSSAWAML